MASGVQIIFLQSQIINDLLALTMGGVFFFYQSDKLKHAGFEGACSEVETRV